MSRYYIINGKKLYVYMGNRQKIPVLYIHGAPGIGVLDMERYQSDNFYPKYFLIAPEQRGVWRSEDLKDDEEYNPDLIIEDYEQLRRHLKIDKWIVLCHCIGARMALQYYSKYSSSIGMILCENPVLDSLSAFESIIKIQLSFIKKDSPVDFERFSSKLRTIHTPLDLEKFCQQLEKKTHHCKSLYERIYDIIESVKVPMLIMHGEQDVTVPKNVIDQIKIRSSGCCVKSFKNCKHWIHLDCEQEYFQSVDEFIVKNLAKCGL